MADEPDRFGSRGGSGAEVTAIVVYHSEQEQIEACLDSLTFVGEILVVNVNDTNDPLDLAQWLGVEVLDRPGTAVVEETLLDVVEEAEHDWLVLIDPDERIDPQLADDLIEAIRENPDASAIRAPWRFYFRGEPLETTEWGRPYRRKTAAVHRERVEFQRHVHRGYRIRGPTIEIEAQGTNAIHHFWCDSYSEFLDKHRRYINEEGRARYENGHRFSFTKLVYRTLRSLGKNLLYHRGLLGGPDGIALSFLRAWYEAKSWWVLRDYEKRRQDEPGLAEGGAL